MLQSFNLQHTFITINHHKRCLFAELDDYSSFGSIDPGFFISVSKKALPKAQLTQGIENFDSFSIFSLKQKLQQVFKS